MSLTIGVDVGGTKIAAGLVDEQGNILKRTRKPTVAADSAHVLQTITDAIAEVREGADVSAVGLGAAGFVDAHRQNMIFSPNLAWRNEPLAEQVSKRVGLPVIVENDANAAAWAEYRFGAANGHRSAVVVTVGTGIGGGIIIDGKLLRGSSGFGAEIGHMNMVPNGELCGCGLRGCWEMYSSGGALLRAARRLATDQPEKCTLMLDLAGGDPGAITGMIITNAANGGCAGAIEAFREIGTWLGQGLADLSAILDPDIFVLAGGVSEAGDFLAAPVREAYELRLTARAYRPLPPIELATLGNDAGLVGAADLAREI